MPLRVLHLVGAATSEELAELSRLYARDALRVARAQEDHETHVVHVAPGGRWSFPDDLAPASIVAAPTTSVAAAVARIAALDVDVMVPQMFCVPGMTHHRALFDLLGVPYVGNPPDVMAVAADKRRARAVVAAAGVDVPRGETVRAGGTATLEPPVVVKPVQADNSAGVTLVRDREDLAPALAVALEHGDEALVEAYVPLGREVRCGVLERGGGLVALPLEEYRVDGVRTAADKLDRDADGALRLVAKTTDRAWIVDPDDPVVAPVQEAARRCHRALRCRDHGLFDFRIDPDGRPWFLEASLYCSFSPASVLSVMAAADGLATDVLYRDAVRAVVDAAARGER